MQAQGSIFGGGQEHGDARKPTTLRNSLLGAWENSGYNWENADNLSYLA